MNKPIPNRQNTENKKKLIEAAKKLFYEKGYDATTLVDISRESGVNNGLITYYFGSKVNLASLIYTAFMLELRNEIARALYEIKKGYQLELGVAMETRLHLSLKFENPHLMRFANEYSKEKGTISGGNESGNEKRSHYYKLQQRLINPSLSDIDLKLYSVCGTAITRALTSAYSNGYYDCDVTYIEDYAIRRLFDMLGLPAFQTEAIVEETRFLKDQVSIKVGPYFRIINDRK